YLGIDGKTNKKDLARIFAKTNTFYTQTFGEPIKRVRYNGIFRWLARWLNKLEQRQTTGFS
ncbi:MAG: hypothetical protein K0R24_150, partial [Gammaproteobacteria bacterium]|nr:hypothetical protein [Gammaproteobacteria bacterium]